MREPRAASASDEKNPELTDMERRLLGSAALTVPLLAAVTYVDAAGAQLLRDLRRDGVEIVGCVGYVRELLGGGQS